MAKANNEQQELAPAGIKKPLIEALDLARSVIGDTAAIAGMQEAMKLKIRSEAYLHLKIAQGRADERQVVERLRNRIKYAFEKKRRHDEPSESLIKALTEIINRLP